MRTMQKPKSGSMYAEFPVLKFTGLNTRESSIHIDDSQSPDLMNVHFDNKGEITKRNGFAVFSTIDTNPVVSMFTYFKSSGTKYLLATSTNKIYDITSGTASYINKQGIANPTTAPTLATATTGGSLPAATYYVSYSWVTANGETLTSPEASITTSGTTSTITATIPAFPANVTSANMYIGTTSGAGTKQGNTTTISYTQSAALVTGTTKPSSNTAGQFLTSVTNNQRFTATTYKDTLYMMNGADGLMKWDGTTYSVVSGAPAGKYVLVHKNRLYICGDPSNPSRVYFSDLGSPESFPALNFTDINTNDGDVITGMAEHLDSLVIFKERSIHVLKGSDPSNFVMIDSHQSRGTVSHWSIVSIQNHLFYLARDGVFYYDGKLIHLASDLIRGSVMGYNNNSAWNQTNLSLACAVDYGHKYWIAIPEGGSQATNNRIYLLDYTHGTWTRYDIPVSCFCLFPNIMTLYSGSPSTGKVYTQDTGTSDDGANITAYYRTKDFDFGAPAHFKTFKGLLFEAREAASQYSINISYIQDFDRSIKIVPLSLGPIDSLWDSMTWDVDSWGSLARVVTKTTAVAGQSRYLAFNVTDTSQNPWSFLGWVVRYQVKRRLA